MAETTVETLQIKVDLDSEQAEKGLDRLTNTIKGMKSFGSIFKQSFGVFTSNAQKATASANSLTRSLIGLHVKVMALKSAFNSLKGVMEISSDLTEAQNVVRTVFGQYEAEIDDASKKALDTFGISELAYKKMASTYMAMGSTLGISTKQMKDMSVTMTELSADMASFFNVDVESASKALESVFTGQTRPMRQFGIDITQATLQQWALSQGINANISSMTQAEKAMLRYKYITSQLSYVVGDFKDTQDTWHNSLVRLEQSLIQLGTIVGGTLINVFKPFINMLSQAMKSVISFAQTVSDALGHIFGWKIEVTDGHGGIGESVADMVDSIDSASDGIGGLSDGAGSTADKLGTAAENAKKLKATILGFDELNVLNAPDTGSSSGSGSGGSGSGSGSGSGGLGSLGAYSSQLVRSETIFKDIESDIDNLYELGERIQSALIFAMKSIDWNSVYEKARGFGKGLADFLNGLISPNLFYQLGRTVGNSINTAFLAMKTFVYTFDWGNLGRTIATGLNSLSKHVNSKQIADALVGAINGAFTSLENFTATFEWDEVAKDIQDGIARFIEGVDWEKNRSALNEFVKNLCDFIKKAVTEDQVRTIAYQLQVTLEELPWGDILSAVGHVFWNGFVGAMDATITALTSGDIGRVIGAAFLSVEVGKIFGLKVFSGLIVRQLITYLMAKHTITKLSKALGNVVSQAAEEAGTGGTATASGGNIFTKIGSGIANKIIGGLSALSTPLAGLGSIGALFGTSAYLIYRDSPLDKSLQNLSNDLTSVGAISDTTNDKIYDMLKGMGQDDTPIEKQVDSFLQTLADSGVSFGVFSGSLEKLRADGQLTNEVYDAITSKLGEYKDKMKGDTEELSLAFDDTSETLGKVSLAVEEAVESFINNNPDTTSWLAARDALDEVRNSSVDATDYFDKLGGKLESLGIPMDTVIDYLKEKMPEAFQTTKDSADTTSGGIGGVWGSFQDLFSGFNLIGAFKMLAMGTAFKNLGKKIGNSSDGITTWYDELISGITDGENNVNSSLGTIGALFAGLTADLSGAGLNAGSGFVTGIVNGMNGVHIPTPHLYISSWSPHKTGDRTFSTPNFDVSWYKNGGLFSKADIIGVGEAGKEAVLPLENARAMKTIADSITDRMGSDALIDAIASGGMQVAMASSGDGNAPYVMNITLKTMDNEVLARAVERGNLNRNMRLGR